MRTAILAAAIVAVFAAAPALAEDEEGANCISGQSDMDACSSPNVQQADQRLNDVYRSLRGDLSAQDKVRLRDSERAWIAFRDKECAFRTSSTAHGGNYTQQLSVCLAEMTNERLTELNRIASCRADASGCPWSGSN